ncbi:uncharacterized protein LOC135335283 isoform X4 [Halichondria panicea]
MSLDLEPPSCNNTNTGETKCVDYLQVSRGGGDFGFLEVCGNVTPVSLRSQLDSGTVEVILRTSEDGRFPGFSAAVVCVSTALLQGLDDGGTSLPRIDGSGVSAKLDQFNSRVRRQVEYVHRVRRSTEEQARSLACSVDDVNIPFDAGITYNNKVVSIVDMATMNVIRRLPAPINKLTILDNSGSQQEFYREAPLTNSTVMIFPGPGPLTRAGVFVFFTSVTTIPELGNISPQLVIPSGQDADVTASLLAGHVSQASNGQIECNYTDNKILLALLNRHIVNPVLETVIDVVLNCTNREQPGKIEQIAASIPLDFQFSQEVISGAEENGTVCVCVEIVTDIFLPRNVEIRVFTQDGNATEPGDYTAVNATVTFISGTVCDGPGSEMCIDIDIVSDDNLVEFFDEVFLVTAQSLDPNVNVINNTTVIIVDSDALDVQFSQEVISGAEENGTVRVCVEIVTDIFLPRNVEIRVFTQDGNATEPGDYTAVNATVTFFSGTGLGSEMCIDIDIVSEDNLVEFDEVFLVTAQSLNPNVNVINNTTVIIIDSDALDVQFSQEVISGAEENGTVRVCVEIVTDIFLPINVEIRVFTQDGNATEPGDYTAVNATVTFVSGTGPGSEMCIDIDIVSDDDLVEFDEVFLVTAQSLDPNVNVINNITVIIVNSDEPVFRFTQGVVTACESEGVAMVFGIELVSSTLAIPIDITIEMDNVLNTLTFPSGSVPNSNTTLNLITTLNGTNRILLAMATVTPLGSFQFNMNSATVALFTNDSEPVLYCTSFVRGASSDDGFVGVNLQNGPFRFLEQNYTSIFVSSNGYVSLSAAFTIFSPRVLPLVSSNPPVLAPFWSDSDPSAGGLVLYAETQDSMLLTRAANEVSTAFPGQPTFTPMSLFIATWLQVPPFDDPEVNTFQVVMASDGQRSFVLFLYDDIQGTNGGRALAGINGGDGVRSVTVPGSLSLSIMNIMTTSNVGRPGVWMFRVDTSAIIDPSEP